MSGEAALDEFHAALLDDDAEALYERAPCGYLSTTPDGTIVKINQTLLTLTGFERSDLVGHRTFAELLTAGGRIYHETHYSPMLLMQGDARGIALDIVRPDGTVLPVLVNSVLERAPDGAPIVIRTAVFDATERREYERELYRAKDRAERSEAAATLLAQTLQRTLIPPEPPDVPGLDVATAFRPAGTGAEIGGDFFDVFEIGPGDWAVAIGDVCGKGVGAAVVGSLARHTLRAAAVRHHRPAQMLDVVNEVLLRDESDRFCTVALIRLRQRDGAWTATVSTAGHPRPLLARAGEPITEVGRPGPLLGVLSTPVLSDVEVPLHSGDNVVLYTDGVTEGRRGDEFYGEQRLHDVIERNVRSGERGVPESGVIESGVIESGETARALTDAVMEDLLRFQSDSPRDDIALVTIVVP